MAEQCDLHCQLMQQAYQESTNAHRDMMIETRANAQQSHQLVRATSGIKIGKQDPVEAAAIELITGGQQQGAT